MNRYFTAGLASLIALAPTVTHAEEDCCLPSYMPGEIICDDQACTIYTTYAGVDLNCGWDVFAWGEFLYWKLVTLNTYVAIESDTPLEPNGTQTGLSNKTPYRPGFSVGLGTVLHCFDDWILNLNYTRYHQTFSNTYNSSEGQALASALTGGVFSSYLFNSIRTEFKFNNDIVGVNMQRPNYMGRYVILSPFLGLKWYRRNSVTSQYLSGGGIDLAETTNTFNYSSIGLGAGFDGAWLLCWGLRVIGKADVSLFYAYKRKYSGAEFVLGEDPFYIKQRIKHLDIWGKGGVGLGWGSYFCCNRYHVDLAVTFDYVADVPKLGGTTGYMGAVELQGLTVRGRFDF